VPRSGDGPGTRRQHPFGIPAQLRHLVCPAHSRQGIGNLRYDGKLLPVVEEMWQNTTRRWAYCARWFGEGVCEVQECRGPFDAPGQPVSAEKVMPPTAMDVGLLFLAANRVLFDRMKIPTLSLSDEKREVLFLDSLEVGETQGVEFVLNQMTKHPANPLISPGPLGSKDDRHVFSGLVKKRGNTYSMEYSNQSWDKPDWQSGALTISIDGVHWQKVSTLPAGLATIRVNGWTYYTPKPDEYRGTVTTIPVDAPAGLLRGLTVNVERTGSPKTAFAVEVLDAATDTPVKGFGMADCLPLKTDGIAVHVAWKKSKTLPTGKALRLRFHLRGKGVRLYSFGFRSVP